MRRLTALWILTLALSFASAASAMLYVAGEDGSVSAIDEGTFQVVHILVGANPSGIGVNTVTDRIYSANTPDGTVSVIDAATNAVIATIPVGIEPRRIGVDELVCPGVIHVWGGKAGGPQKITGVGAMDKGGNALLRNCVAGDVIVIAITVTVKGEGIDETKVLSVLTIF